MRLLELLGNEHFVKDKVGKHGATPLSVAAKYDQLSSVQYLIEAGADKDPHQQAIRASHRLNAVACCSFSHEPEDKIGLHGASPLFIAAKYGQVLPLNLGSPIQFGGASAAFLRWRWFVS